MTVSKGVIMIKIQIVCINIAGAKEPDVFFRHDFLHLQLMTGTYLPISRCIRRVALSIRSSALQLKSSNDITTLSFALYI